MNQKTNSISRVDILLAIVAMSLGWGLRGTIGGGEVGAMIPGALIGMILAEIAGISRVQSGLIAAASALGFGLGGAETYGQTIGLLRENNNAAWGMLGLSLKGGAWGLGASLLIWIAFHSRKLTDLQILISFALMVAGTLAGWWFVDHPKLIYFSDPVNKPREEVWFGQIIGPLISLIYLVKIVNSKKVYSWAISGFIAGALGFGLGSLWLLAGFRWPVLPRSGPWWKLMEFSFGAILGAGFAVKSAQLFADSEIRKSSNNTDRFSLQNAILGFLLSTFSIAFQFNLPHRMPFLFLAPILMFIVLKYPAQAWHVALSITIIGFVRDVMENHFNAMDQLSFLVASLLRNAIVALFVEWLVSRKKFSNSLGVAILSLSGYLAWLLRDYFAGQISIAVVPAIFTIEMIIVILVCSKKIQADSDMIN
jgi:hypothetical protein